MCLQGECDYLSAFAEQRILVLHNVCGSQRMEAIDTQTSTAARGLQYNTGPDVADRR